MPLDTPLPEAHQPPSGKPIERQLLLAARGRLAELSEATAATARAMQDIATPQRLETLQHRKEQLQSQMDAFRGWAEAPAPLE